MCEVMAGGWQYYLRLLHELLPGLRDLVPLGVDGGRVVGVYGGQARGLAVQRGHFIFQSCQVALHAFVLALWVTNKMLSDCRIKCILLSNDKS